MQPEIPEHEKVTRRSQFSLKNTIKEERQAKKGKGKGKGTGKGKGPRKGKASKKGKGGTQKKQLKPKHKKLKRVVKQAEIAKKRSASTEKENANEQDDPNTSAQAEVEQQKKRPRSTKPKAKAKAKATTQASDVNRGSRKKGGSKATKHTQDPQTWGGVDECLASIAAQDTPELDTPSWTTLSNLIDSDPQSEKAAELCTMLLGQTLTKCAQHGQKPCDGSCHDFVNPLSKMFQLSTYWSRRAVGVKVKEYMTGKGNSNQFKQVAYFACGPCTYANFQLAKLWVTCLHKWLI